MNGWLVAAAGLSMATLGVHIVIGGREAARPLLASTDLDRNAKFTNYYCWHFATIVIGALAVAFAYAAWAEAAADLALFTTAMALLFALWSLAMIARFRLPPMRFGQWALFLPIGILGLIGSLA